MTHGGKRTGAGRPRGSNVYGESTKAIRIPLSRLNEIKALIQHKEPVGFPLYSSRVRAGFPSPADDYIETHLDLNKHLIRHPTSTFFLIASGDSMKDAGIHSGDMLIVDKSIEPVHGRVVIAAIEGELTVKRLSINGAKIQLLPANDQYPPIDITHTQDLVIWGVVMHVIHQVS